MPEQLIPIHTELDVMTARMQVRNAARQAGLNTADQARISLATTSIAHSMGLGNGLEGQVVIDCVENGGHKGLRVTCIQTGPKVSTPNSVALQDAKWMVDELSVNKLSSTEIHVCLTKWLAGVVIA